MRRGGQDGRARGVGGRHRNILRKREEVVGGAAPSLAGRVTGGLTGGALSHCVAQKSSCGGQRTRLSRNISTSYVHVNTHQGDT